MANVNKVFLIGNLTAEPEIRQLPSGDTILREHDKVLVVTGVKQVTELNQILRIL